GLADPGQTRRPDCRLNGGIALFPGRGSGCGSRLRRFAGAGARDVRRRGATVRERRNGLARADRRRAQREARHARRIDERRRSSGHGTARVAENTMFFPRLRNQAKWAFVFLIVVFAGGFIFLGVGSGGLDLGQLMRDAFGRGGSSGPSISDAQKKVSERPFNAQYRKQLAQAYENKGRTDEAIAAWLEYGKLRPKDVVALRHLGDLELGQANSSFQAAQLASLQQSQAAAGNQFRPTTGKLGQALGTDPLSSAAPTQASRVSPAAVTQYRPEAARAT